MTRSEARDPDGNSTETWVQFWRALLRLWAVEGLLAVTGEVGSAEEGAEAHARVRCVPASELEPALLTDVKAVTWHGAEAKRRADGTWCGRIVLDI